MGLLTDIMGTWPIFLVVVVSTFGLLQGTPQYSRDILLRPVTYVMTKPMQVLVNSDHGMLVSRVVPGVLLRIEDPTNDLICRHLQKDQYTAFFVPPSHVPTLRQHPFFENILPDIDPSENPYFLENDDSPTLVFTKSENINTVQSDFRRINLRLSDAKKPMELSAYTMSNSELGLDSWSAENPDGVVSAPPPFFPSLCVSPDKPRPVPLLLSPVAASASSFPVASFSASDLTPAVQTSVPPK